MRVLAALSQVALALAGLWSMVSFTLVMLGDGSVGWLLLGWFALPVTAVVWPAVLGSWWTWPFYLLLLVGTVISVASESDTGKQQDDVEELPGGFTAGVGTPGLLYSSNPLPPEIHGEDQVAKGLCVFMEPALLSSELPSSEASGPSRSPPLGFKMTRNGIWTLNPDGTLYSHIDWDQTEKLVITRHDDRGVRWLLRGSYNVGQEFRVLDVEPAQSTSQAFVDLLQEKGIEIDNRLPSTGGPDV